MTVSTSTSRSGPYAGAAQLGPFLIGFRFLDASHLQVVQTNGGVETTLTLNVDYTVTGAGGSGGTLTLTTALPVGQTLTIVRNVPLTQDTDYVEGSSFPAQSHEDGLDKLTMIAQQLQQGVNGALRVPEVATLPAFPAAASRANKLASFDSAGNPIAVAPVSGSASALATDIANAASSSNGAGQVGADMSLAYAALTIGAAVQDGMVNVLWFMTQAERAQVKANGTTLDLTAKINAAKTWAGNRPLYLPAGTYSITTLSFIGNYGGLVGDGINVTTLLVRSAITTALNFNETTDVNPSAFVLRGFTLDGANLTTNGANVRYRHNYLIESVLVRNCTNGIVEKDTYLSRHRNVRIQLCTTGWTLVGSNHSSTFIGCTIEGCSGTHLLVQSLGTALDGNNALCFINCDIEFGTGVGADITCSDIEFFGCYLGENISGAVLLMRSGLCVVKGGALFYGWTTSSYGVNPVGGKVTVDGAQINGQVNPGIGQLIGTGTGGKVSFRDSQYNGLVSGTPVIPGDVLDYGPPAIVFAPRLGKNWTGEGNNVTLSSVITGNTQKFTVLTAPGPTPLLGAKATLASPGNWRDGETLYLVLVYESTQVLNVSLSASGFGGAPTKSVQAALPATAGTPKTAMGFQVAADNAAYTLIEAIQAASGVNDFITIYECFLADSRMLNKGSGQFGNLYKC